MNDHLNITPEEPSEIVKPSGNRVEVSADVLNEAVSQLRKLTEIRQRESERQERAIAQMHTAIKRQSILSRYVIVVSLLVIIISGALAYFMYVSVNNEKVTMEKLGIVDETLSSTAQAIADGTQRQVSSLDNVRTEVLTTREEQARISNEIGQELKAARESQASVIQKVEEQLGAVRQERDEVRGEVRNMLEEKTEMFTKREIELRAEREAIKEAKIRSKEEQKALIQQTIERLNAMTSTLDSEEDAAAPSDAEINRVVSEVDAVEATISEPAAALPEVKEAIAEEVVPATETAPTPAAE